MKYYIFSYLLLVACSGRSQVANDCQPDFNLSELEINNLKVFKLSPDELKSSLSLFQKDVESGITFTDGTNLFTLDAYGLIYFAIKDSLMITNPSLKLGVREEELKKLFPRSYREKVENPSYDRKTQSISVYDCEGNELRIYLLDGSIDSISYFAYEDEEDWGNE